jgi:signal transduction histidine kinase
MKPCDLNRVVTTTLTVARNEYKYVAELVADLQEDLPQVTCLAGEVGQVVLNMVVNAAHAIAEKGAGQGTIRVATRAVGDEVQIAIGDSGTGIPPAVRERIFDPFFTTKPVGKGTGQGLFLAHAVVVRKHGGRIDVASVVGEGTTFTIVLPRVAA